jgi:energy-coupling factor transport system ATP-binding protein
LERRINAMIQTKNLYFKFNNDSPLTGQPILSNINLTINKGEFVSIIGKNGSGKSTLAKHFNAMLFPSEGKVYVNGMDASDPQFLWNIRQSVGMVFQNPDNQLVAAVVEEDVAFGPENMGINPEEIRKRVDYALGVTGMTEYKKHAPHILSGGQKQKVAIAGVFAMKPECIVLDEPTAMLDPIGRREVIKTIKNLNEQERITIILITHYMEEAAEADRIFVMDEGKIIMQGKPKEIFTKVKELKRVGLSVPETTELVAELSEEGIDVRHDILTVEECTDELYRLLK